MRTQIEKLLEKFPKDATGWRQATDEIRDLSRMSREHLEELDDVIVEPLDFRSLRTPAEWNTKGRENIMANFYRMSDTCKKAYFERVMRFFADED